MGLFFKKKKVIVEKNKINESKAIRKTVDMEHLAKDGELPCGWYYANKDFTIKMEEEYRYFLENCYKTVKLSPKEYRAALKSLVLYMEDAQKLCYSKNECFAFWFDGVIASPKYIEEEKQKLHELESNLEQLQKEWECHQVINKEIVEIIKENDGIIQSDLYKRFDATDKNYISNALYMMDAKGEIERVKQGRSYALHIKTGQE